jgi:hypothetical protein
MESLGFLGSFGGRRGFWGWGSPSLVREGGRIVGLGMEFLGGGMIGFWGVFGERPYRVLGSFWGEALSGFGEFLGRGLIVGRGWEGAIVFGAFLEGGRIGFWG